jgi:hypothetical protein
VAAAGLVGSLRSEEADCLHCRENKNMLNHLCEYKRLMGEIGSRGGRTYRSEIVPHSLSRYGCLGADCATQSPWY